MRKPIRFGIAAAAATSMLAFAGSALAAINPTFVVVAPPNTGQGPSISIRAELKSINDDAVGRLQIYAPLGYQLHAPSPGAKVGNVRAKARPMTAGGKAVALRGQIMSVDPATLSTQSLSCDNVDHAAAWMMQLSGSGQSLNVPIFVDETSGAEAKLAAYKLVMCESRLYSTLFDVNAFTNPPANGEYRWRSLWTPADKIALGADESGAVESQSLVRIPTTVSLNVKKARVHRNGKLRTLVTLSGFLMEHRAPIAGARVSVLDGKTMKSIYRLKSVFTKRDGSYVKKLYIDRPSYFTARVTTPLRTLGAAGCEASFGPSIPCVSAFVGGNHVLSKVVRINPFKR